MPYPLPLPYMKDTTGFQDLFIGNQIRYVIYKQACLAHVCGFDDKGWIDGLEESVLSKMPSVMESALLLLTFVTT